MTKCKIRFEMLVDFAEGKLSSTDQKHLVSHLDATCDDCADRLSEIRLFAKVASAGPLETPSELVMRQAKGVYRERFVPRARKSIFATLIHDSRLSAAPAGARAAGSAAAHLIYSADELDIDLWQEPVTGGNWSLVGQALRQNVVEPIVPVSANLTTNSRTIPLTISEGTLTADSIPAGEYSLEIDLGDHRTIHAEFRVGS